MKLYEYHDLQVRGTIVRVDYTSKNKDGIAQEKYANVYLPNGYDEAKKYNVLYVMHGGGGSADAWLDSCPTKNMLDHLFSTGEANSCIVVFPSYYSDYVPHYDGPWVEREWEQTRFFQTELVRDLLPAIEGKFSTYAENVTEEGLKASRDHRAFSGFSMGGCTTWFAFTHNLAYFAYFAPLSGDSWEIQPRGGADKTEETVKLLRDIVRNGGFTAKDFKIFAATGDKDIAFPNLNPQIDAMKKLDDVFVYDEDLEKGNLHFLVLEGGVHAYPVVFNYLYNIIPYLFK